MKSFKNLILGLLALTSVSAFAGTDHDHGVPTFQAPKGGVLKSTNNAHFELIKNQNIVKIYAYNQEGNSLPTKGFKLTANLELPRKKATPISLTDKTTHWETTVDPQGAHRFTLNVNIEDGKEKDDVKFTVESK